MNHRYELSEMENRIAYVFQNQTLLKQALTHSSYSNEKKIYKYENYERLEFLGDAVLELTVSEHLYFQNPDMHEGNMTKMRASLVCEPTLAYCGRSFQLGDFILLGKGEELTGGRNRDSIISDVFEAVIGAIYLDGGFTSAKEFIYKFVLNDMENKILFFDSKTILQEKVQEKGQSLTYKIISESGPDHDKEYVVAAIIDDITAGEGIGRTKKSAEQQAAYQVLLNLTKE